MDSMKRLEELMQAPEAVFVFGSNVQGIHGKGAALTALEKYGAVKGVGFGLRGKSFGISTRSFDAQRKLYTLSLSTINTAVSLFLDEADKLLDKKFYVTRIGCGYAGWTDW